MLRGVILDYGGVLSREPTAEALARLHALCELDAEVFADAGSSIAPATTSALTAAE